MSSLGALSLSGSQLRPLLLSDGELGRTMPLQLHLDECIKLPERKRRETGVLLLCKLLLLEEELKRNQTSKFLWGILSLSGLDRNCV